MRRRVRPLGPALPLVLLLLGGCTDPVMKVAESSLRNATARSVAEELRGRGYTLSNGLRCRTLSPDTMSVVRVRCGGRTTRNEPVVVDAVASDAGSAHPRQEFVITVDGHRVVHKSCLGHGCQDRER